MGAAFQKRLSELGFASYSDYLDSERWGRFKADYFKSVPKLCAVCSRRHVQLHHVTYVRLGRERFNDVTPLCRRHHREVHAWLASRNLSVESSGDAINAIRDELKLAPAPVKIKGSVKKAKRREAAKKRKAARLEEKARKAQSSARSIAVFTKNLLLAKMKAASDLAEFRRKNKAILSLMKLS